MSDSESRVRRELDRVAVMAYRVVENAVLRCLVGPGRTPMEATVERRNELLGPFAAALESDRAQLEEVTKFAFLRGVESVHTDLHGQPGVDDEMLDDAIEFHSNRTGNGPPVAL